MLKPTRSSRSIVRRGLGLLLSVLMLMTMLPAFALSVYAEEPEKEETSTVDKVEGESSIPAKEETSSVPDEKEPSSVPSVPSIPEKPEEPSVPEEQKEPPVTDEAKPSSVPDEGEALPGLDENGALPGMEDKEAELIGGTLSLDEEEETVTIASGQMVVELDKAFPRVIEYRDTEDNFLMHGQLTPVTQVELNAQNGSQNNQYYGREGVLVTPDQVTFREGTDAEAGKAVYYDLAVSYEGVVEHKTAAGASYTMPGTSDPVKSEVKIDAVITVKYTVEDNVLNFDITEVVNNLDEKKWPVTSIHFPDNAMVSVTAKQAGADFAAARMSNNVQSYGDIHGFDKPTNKYWAHYAFVNHSAAGAGAWSNSEMGLNARDAQRVIANVAGTEEERVVGLQSNRFWYQSLIRGERSQTDTLYAYAFPELKNEQITVDHLHNGRTGVPGWYLVEPVDMPHAAVAIAVGDVNGDDKVDWQDAAIESRQLFPDFLGSSDVPETVGWRIAQNFSGQAGNPFLLTLDNIKRVSLQTDGLGQGVLHKGYGNEGHDSGHPDFWDIGTRMGGADEFNYLLEKAQDYGARIGIHCNTGEMYPEAKAYDDEFVRRNDQMNSTENSSLRLGWNWLDQGVGLDGRFDHGSGRRFDRWSRLKEALGEDRGRAVATGLDNFPNLGAWSSENNTVRSKLNFVYLDIWGNNTDSENNQWATRQVLYEINRLGWNFASEWGYLAEGRGIMQHWATDLLYGSYTSKGNNSPIMRFLRNHQSDSWIAEHSSGNNYGFASTAPLLGGANMKDFEGWQGRNSYSAYVDNFWAFNVSTKFLQHFTVNQVKFGEPYNNNFTPETFVQLVSAGDKGWFNPAGDVVEVTRGSDKYVGTYGGSQALPPEAVREDVFKYRSRTITLNGKKILEGEMAVDATTGTVSTSHTNWLPMLRTEKYLIPWVWDSITGEKLPLAKQRLFHYNQDAANPTTTWELPDEWISAGLTKVYVYELADTGRMNEQEVAVVDGKITLTAKQRVAYAVYAQSTPKLPATDMNWGDGIHVADANFNSMDLEGSGWDLDVADGSIEMAYTFVDVPQVRMRGNASMTTDMIDLKPNTGYVVYVNADNRSLGDATMALLHNGEVVDSVYSNTSIAPNYVRTDPHSANNPTTSTSNSRSLYQRMFLFFETPDTVSDGDYQLRLSHEKGKTVLWEENETFQDAVFWDNIRVTENASVGDKANIKATDTLNGKKVVTEYFQDFENMACGLYPFVMGSAWGVEDNRAHLSELHAPYTQGGWDVKLLDDVIDGNWSVKVNGTPSAGRTVMQTIPQLFRFEPGQTYEISFDYEMGSPDTFRFVVGDGNLYNPNASTGAMSSISTTVPSASRIPLNGEALGRNIEGGGPKRFTYTVTGAESGQTWVGIVRHGNAASQSSNFVGRADFVLDNLSIKMQVTDVESVKISGAKSVKRNKTLQLTAAVLPENATFKDVTWTSLNTKIATVDENGLVKAANKTGYVYIQAETSNGKKTTYMIQVTA